MRTNLLSGIALICVLAVMFAGCSKTPDITLARNDCIVDKIKEKNTNHKLEISKKSRDAACEDSRQKEVLEHIYEAKLDPKNSDGFELKFKGRKGGTIVMNLGESFIDNEGEKVEVDVVIADTLHGVKLKEMSAKMVK